jgi:transposase
MQKNTECNERIAIGLDVSKLTVDACLLLSNGKKQSITIDNTNSGFVHLASFLHGLTVENIHACLEPTGRYSRPLSNFLSSLGIKTSLVNSFTVKNHGRSKNVRSKSDRIDSFLLADYCMMHNPPGWTPPSKTRLELRDIQNRLANIAEQIRQEENRLEAGLESTIVREDIEESLVRLMMSKDRLEKEARKLIKSDTTFSTNFTILKSIIGVGDVSAVLLLASIVFNEFPNGRTVGAFAGLAPVFHESGTSVRSKPRISKTGSSRLRGGLYFPAICAIQHNPQIREFAERLKSKNKPGKVIICAVMRKLLVVASALIRKQELYDPTHGLKTA